MTSKLGRETGPRDRDERVEGGVVVVVLAVVVAVVVVAAVSSTLLPLSQSFSLSLSEADYSTIPLVSMVGNGMDVPFPFSFRWAKRIAKKSSGPDRGPCQAGNCQSGQASSRPDDDEGD